MLRDVQPERLDHLAHNDPAAVRSRSDLRMINAIMGNHRWLQRRVTSGSVVELGAGDGSLARKLAVQGIEVTALDLAPAPDGLPGNVHWEQGDFFECFPENLQGGVIAACLVLHHFKAEALAALGRLIQQSSADRLIAAEPHRSRIALLQGRVLFPFVNEVTRHDMMVSIRAGFRRGELASALELAENGWTVEESVTVFGALRFEATRQR